MEIKVKVITRAKENKIKKEKDLFKVYLTAVPEKNKANKSLIKLLANYYNLSPSQFKIKQGLKASYKIIEIIDFYL